MSAQRRTNQDYSASEGTQESTEHGSTASSEARERLKESAGVAGERLKQQAERFASVRESHAGVALGDLGAAVREAARCLRERDDQTAASWTDVAADRIESLADDLQRGDARKLIHSVEDFARRRPEISLASMFVAGLGVARFLKSSAHRSHDESGVDSPLKEEAGEKAPYGRQDEGRYDPVYKAQSQYNPRSDEAASRYEPRIQPEPRSWSEGEYPREEGT